VGANGFANQTGATSPFLTSTPQTILSVTVTPTKSGLFKLHASLAIDNTDGANAHVANLSCNDIATTNGVSTTIPAAASLEAATFLAVSTAQSLGVPVTFNLTAADPANTSRLLVVGGLAASWFVVEEL
jgi:ribosomal protein L11